MLADTAASRVSKVMYDAFLTHWWFRIGQESSKLLGVQKSASKKILAGLKPSAGLRTVCKAEVMYKAEVASQCVCIMRPEI